MYVPTPNISDSTQRRQKFIENEQKLFMSTGV